MSHSIDQYLVFKDGLATEFDGGWSRVRAWILAVEIGADKVWEYVSDEDTHRDISEDFAIQWLDNHFTSHNEVPAILPDFIKRHLPPEAIEEKRNQQLNKGMR